MNIPIDTNALRLYFIRRIRFTVIQTSIDGVWYVLDTQGRCFLTENMCEFTELVDVDENHVAKH